MNSFGNRREIQQGEDWNLDILVSASDREYIPFIVSSGRVNPYFVLTVASTKYEKNMRYVASWWNNPEGKIVGESLPTFYQTTPVDIGVLSSMPTSSFTPEDIPEEYQTDESPEKRYLYRFMLESESVEAKTGHRPYHYLYFEYPNGNVGRLCDAIDLRRILSPYYSNIKNMHIGAEDESEYEYGKTMREGTIKLDVGLTPSDGVFAYLHSDGSLYILPSDYDVPIILPEYFDYLGGSPGFFNCKEIHINRVDSSNVVSMSFLFYGMSVERIYLNGVHIDSCTNLESMFMNDEMLQRIYVNDTFLSQLEEKMENDEINTIDFFTGVVSSYSEQLGIKLVGRNGEWTRAKQEQYEGVNLPYSEIYDCTLHADDTSLTQEIVCHVDDYECHIRFNLESDVTGEWNGQEYQYAITLVDGPTLIVTLQTIAMSHNGGVLPDDYPTNLVAQYEYVKTKYPDDLSTDIDVTSPLGKIEHPESILRPSDLKVYNNLRKLI